MVPVSPLSSLSQPPKPGLLKSLERCHPEARSGERTGEPALFRQPVLRSGCRMLTGRTLIAGRVPRRSGRIHVTSASVASRVRSGTAETEIMRPPALVPASTDSPHGPRTKVPSGNTKAESPARRCAICSGA